MKLNPIVFIVLGVLLLVGLFFIFKPKTQNTPTNSQPNTQQINNPQVFVDTKTIIMKPDSFEPANIIVQKGTKIVFKNDDSTERWPASAMHPTHTRYPGSGIDKCGTIEEKNIFDACRGIAPGKEYSFVFNEVGEWNYHDHLTPSIFGKITVTEKTQQAQDTTKKTFNIVVKNKQLVSGGGTLTVTQGDEVTIRVTSDTPDSLHLHGYDKSVQVEKDTPAVLTFTANLSGRFEYELEESQLSFGALEVQPK